MKAALRAGLGWSSVTCAAFPGSRENWRNELTVTQKMIWAIFMAGLTGLLYLAFRGYLTPAMLLDFANTMLC